MPGLTSHELMEAKNYMSTTLAGSAVTDTFTANGC